MRVGWLRFVALNAVYCADAEVAEYPYGAVVVVVPDAFPECSADGSVRDLGGERGHLVELAVG